MQFKKVLITGLPKSGKSTLLRKLIQDIPHKNGFLENEVRVNGVRTGFEITTASGFKTTLASVTVESPVKVAKYFVQVENIDRAVDHSDIQNDSELLYLDEIGQMELYSLPFKDLLAHYLSSPNIFIGTITKIFTNEYIEAIKARKDIKVIEITEENRDKVYEELKQWLEKVLHQ